MCWLPGDDALGMIKVSLFLLNRTPDFSDVFLNLSSIRLDNYLPFLYSNVFLINR